MNGRARPLVRAEQLASVDRDQTRWRHRYNAGAAPLSPVIRASMSSLAQVRARRASRECRPDAWLQLTGWYRPRPQGRVVRASFHDGNLATFLQRPDLRLDRTTRSVKRALAHERRLYDEMDVILTMSEWLRRSFLDDFEQDPEKVVAVGAGPNFDAPPDVPERRWTPLRALFVGKDWERKGGPAVLRAFARVREQQPGAELAIIGPERLPGPIPEGVNFHGRLMPGAPELRAAFASATAFLMPSVYEPFGIALLEAMAYGLPCIAGDACAMPEIVEEGETGFLVAPGDTEALADRLGALAAQPRLAEDMGRAARRRMDARFTWRAVAERAVEAIATNQLRASMASS